MEVQYLPSNLVSQSINSDSDLFWDTLYILTISIIDQDKLKKIVELYESQDPVLCEVRIKMKKYEAQQKIDNAAQQVLIKNISLIAFHHARFSGQHCKCSVLRYKFLSRYLFRAALMSVGPRLQGLRRLAQVKSSGS